MVRWARAYREANRPTVLVVDDDDGVRTSLRFLLEEEFEPLLADSGPAALEIFGAYPVDVVLLDVRMPRMDGLTVLRRMKALNPLVEVIVVSAVTDIAIAVAATKLGAYDYVSKPFAPHELCAKVRSAAARRRRDADAVLLVGSDLGGLAALEVVLDQHGVGVRSVAADRVLATCGSWHPLLILFDTTRSAVLEASTVRALRAAFPDRPLVVTSPDLPGARILPDFATVLPWALVAKPYRLDALLARLGPVLASYGGPHVSWDDITPAVVTALDYVIQRHRHALLTVDIARAAGVSTDHLARVFKAAIGMGIRDFVLRVRLGVARRLLVDTDQTLDQVAERCGFSDVSHFSRVFLEHAGTRPGHYRRRHVYASTLPAPPLEAGAVPMASRAVSAVARQSGNPGGLTC